MKDYLKIIESIVDLNLGFTIQIDFFDHDISYELTLSFLWHKKYIYIKNFHSDSGENWKIALYSVADLLPEETFDLKHQKNDPGFISIDELAFFLRTYLKDWLINEGLVRF